MTEPIQCFLAQQAGEPLPAGAMWQDGSDWWIELPEGPWQIDVPVSGTPPVVNFWAPEKGLRALRGWLFHKSAKNA